MLEGESVRRRVVERTARRVRDRRRKVRILSCLRGIGAFAADQINRVVLQIMRAGTGALVGVATAQPCFNPHSPAVAIAP